MHDILCIKFWATTSPSTVCKYCHKKVTQFLYSSRA